MTWIGQKDGFTESCLKHENETAIDLITQLLE
jgi:hypothetical protein